MTADFEVDFEKKKDAVDVFGIGVLKVEEDAEDWNTECFSELEVESGEIVEVAKLFLCHTGSAARTAARWRRTGR